MVGNYHTVKGPKDDEFIATKFAEFANELFTEGYHKGVTTGEKAMIRNLKLALNDYEDRIDQ